MWTWDQSAGTMSKDGEVVGRGYAGNGAGVNNPDAEGMQGVGPIPRGFWRMTELRVEGASTGPYTIVLEPEAGTDTLGRSAFRIHGDSIAHPGDASHGCIILPRPVREKIWRSGDRRLEVVE